MPQTYWVIAPTHAKFSGWDAVWNYDLREGLISIGWRDVGDVSRLRSCDEVKALAIERLSDDMTISAKSSAGSTLWKFYREIKPGNVVIARRGTKQILAIGTVKAAAHYNPSLLKHWPEGVRKAYPNHLPVRWWTEPRDLRPFDREVFGKNTLQNPPESKVRMLLNERDFRLGASIFLHPGEAQQMSYKISSPFKVDHEDRRLTVERQIKERRGQQAFRDDMRQRFNDSCAVTGCDVLAVLEAAHISPFRGEDDHHVDNGLLLRADIHTLFDLDLLGIDPTSLKVRLHPSVHSEYGYLEGKRLCCPNGERPSSEALDLRYEDFRRRLNDLE